MGKANGTADPGRGATQRGRFWASHLEKIEAEGIAAKDYAAREGLSLEVVNEPRFRDLSPNQIVPLLADEKRYLASESTMYRILREEELLHHRGRAKAPVRRPPQAYLAMGPNEVWSWDITYLKSPIRGVFFYLYMIVDVWSRKTVG